MRNYFHSVFPLNLAMFNKKPTFKVDSLVLLLAVPTGSVPTKRNHFPADYELISFIFGDSDEGSYPFLY